MRSPKRSRVGVRIAIGVLLSAYGLASVIHAVAALRHGLSPMPDILSPGPSTVEWWPVRPTTPGYSVLQASTYLAWVAKGFLLPGGLGTAAGHRPTMRLTIVALFALAALGVLTGAPTALALAAGRVSVDWEEWSRHFGRPVPAEAAAGYLRMYGWLALAGIVIAALAEIAIAVWLKRELARDGGSRSGTAPPAGQSA